MSRRIAQRPLLGAVLLAAALIPGLHAATPLHQVNATLYQTEHVLFVIDASVTWAVPATAYNDIYTYNAGLADFQPAVCDSV